MMDLSPQTDIKPLDAHFLHPVFRPPMEVRMAVWRLTPNRNLGTTYLEVDATSDLRFEFYWIADGVLGHVTGVSNDMRWPEVGLNGVQCKIAGRVRPLESVREVALEDLFFAQDGTSGDLTIETAANVTFDDGASLIIGSADLRNDNLRKRRDDFIDALLRAVAKPVP
jgi:hypothetical protein